MLVVDILSHMFTLLTGAALPREEISPPHTPPPTSRKRHDSMNSAKMNANIVNVVQEIPSPKDSGVLNPNTGFPEPLCPDRNTTLPHPDADTSKNAVIEAGDLELTRTNSRRRFLHSRHHSTKSITKGKLDPAERGLYDNIQYADGSKEAEGGVATNGAAKERSNNNKEEALRIESERDETGYSGAKRKESVLRKLHLHKV